MEVRPECSDMIKLLAGTKFRPSWDEYFMMQAYLISTRSTCDRLHVGCVIVQPSDSAFPNRLVCESYNGFLPGAPHEGFVRDGHEMMTVHAETNAICDAAKRGVSVNGATCYVTHKPCIKCAQALLAGGIKKIIYAEEYKPDNLVNVMCSTVGCDLVRMMF